MKNPNIEDLRRLIERLEGPSRASRGLFKSSLPGLDERLGGGLRPGSLVELFHESPEGVGAWRLAVALLARATEQGYVGYLASEPLLFAPAAAAMGLDLTRVVVVRGERALGLWALEELAGSPALVMSAAALPGLRQGVLRRLQRAAELSGQLLVLLRPLREQSWPGVSASTRVRVALCADARGRYLDVEVLRGRRRCAAPLRIEVDDVTGALPSSS